MPPILTFSERNCSVNLVIKTLSKTNDALLRPVNKTYNGPYQLELTSSKVMNWVHSDIQESYSSHVRFGRKICEKLLWDCIQRYRTKKNNLYSTNGITEQKTCWKKYHLSEKQKPWFKIKKKIQQEPSSTIPSSFQSERMALCHDWHLIE